MGRDLLDVTRCEGPLTQVGHLQQRHVQDTSEHFGMYATSSQLERLATSHSTVEEHFEYVGDSSRLALLTIT